MATRYNYTGKLVTDGLVLNLDAAKRDSYPGSGTTWYDLSGNGNNGTLTNGPTYTGVSKDAAIVFDGVDDSVNTNSTFSNYISSSLPLTFDVLAYVNLSSNDEALVGTNWSNGGVLFRKTSANRVRIIYNTDGSNWRGVDSNTLTSSGWYHIVGSYNGSGVNTSTNYKVFVNTIESYNAVGGGTVTTIPVITNVYIGQTGQSGSNKYFNGKISSVKIYNRALSASEITQNFNALRGRYGI